VKAPRAKKQSRRWRFPLAAAAWSFAQAMLEEQVNRGRFAWTSAASPITFSPLANTSRRPTRGIRRWPIL
jgi:hypothetical protein